MGKLCPLVFCSAWKRTHFLTPCWFTSEVTCPAAEPHGLPPRPLARHKCQQDGSLLPWAAVRRVGVMPVAAGNAE